jgi:protein SDA1
MQLLSRVMGAHKRCVLGFYTYIIRYLTYPNAGSCHTRGACSIRARFDTARCCHARHPEESVHPVVASEVIAAGLNAIREACRRQPWSMEEDLLGDLVDYKAMTSAARGLLQIYREVNPGMLKRRERISGLLGALTHTIHHLTPPG